LYGIALSSKTKIHTRTHTYSVDVSKDASHGAAPFGNVSFSISLARGLSLQSIDRKTENGKEGVQRGGGAGGVEMVERKRLVLLERAYWKNAFRRIKRKKKVWEAHFGMILSEVVVGVGRLRERVVGWCVSQRAFWVRLRSCFGW